MLHPSPDFAWLPAGTQELLLLDHVQSGPVRIFWYSIFNAAYLPAWKMTQSTRIHHGCDGYDISGGEWLTDRCCKLETVAIVAGLIPFIKLATPYSYSGPLRNLAPYLFGPSDFIELFCASCLCYSEKYS